MAVKPGPHPVLKVLLEIDRGKGKPEIKVMPTGGGKHAVIHDPSHAGSNPKDPKEVVWEVVGGLHPHEALVIYGKDKAGNPTEYPKAKPKHRGDKVFKSLLVIEYPDTSVSSGLPRIKEKDGEYSWAYNLTLLRPDDPPIHEDPWVIIQKP